ncbi:MAG: D-aminoacyl-tRNA deacylase [bacterium]|nr:D-aminoacyl-tRNA deacylase [bacterium]
MRVLIQRVSEASVTINGTVSGSIDKGLLLLVGIEHEDTQEDIDWLVKKVRQLRIFSDSEGKMNLSLQDIDGSALVISQFTLHASTKKGNRPSYIRAARPEVAIPLYEAFIQTLAAQNITVETGEFGADMKVHLVNDGPVTIWMDSRDKQ